MKNTKTHLILNQIDKKLRSFESLKTTVAPHRQYTLL